MDFSGIELWIIRGATTVLLSIALLELILHKVIDLWTTVRRVKEIVVETSHGPVKVSVNPESEESVRELLNVVAKADGEKGIDGNGSQ